jgi:hypothetical protein
MRPTFHNLKISLELPVQSLCGVSSAFYGTAVMFLSRELPLRVRSHLEAAVDRALEPLEEGLLNQLVEIVQTAQRELFQSFQAQRLTQREPEANPRRGVANTQDSQENPLETEETDLAVFSFPPLMFDEDWFDPTTFSFQIPLFGSDPAGLWITRTKRFVQCKQTLR